MENSMIQPTKEMDEALSVQCPSSDCNCPSCMADWARDDAAITRRATIIVAAQFLADAALLLDQAHACLKDIKLDREIPSPSMRVNLNAVFANCKETPRLPTGCAHNIEELVIAVVALRQEIMQEGEDL